jgi:hypothetical protein
MKAQDLQFYREELDFRIGEGFFYMDGIYHFCNIGSDSLNTILFYPFPVDEKYGDVDTFLVQDLTDGHKVTIDRQARQGIGFWIALPPYGIKKYRIYYRQPLLGHQAEYILTTTKAWKRPLESAVFTLSVPSEIRITSFSIAPDDHQDGPVYSLFYWKRSGFLPDTNFVVVFE